MKFISFLVIVLFYSQLHAQVPVTIINADDIDEGNLSDLSSLINTANKNPAFLYRATIRGIPNTDFNINQKLPKITGHIEILGDDDDITFTPSGGYTDNFLAIGNGGSATLYNIKVDGFYNQSTGYGGAVSVDNGGYLNTDWVGFSNNRSAFTGGGVYCDTGSTCYFNDSTFDTNHADSYGGAVGCLGDCYLRGVKLRGNYANIFSCDVDAPFPAMVEMHQSTSTDPFNMCLVNNFDVNGGSFSFFSSYIETDSDNDHASCTGNCEYFGTVLRLRVEFKSKSPIENKTVCNDFGTEAFHSLGYNADNANGCFFNHATDIKNTDLKVTIDSNGIPQPASNSPLVESGPVDMIDGILPCGYKDANGLGRPQDFDRDGVFACDRGVVELQGGDNLTNAQSGLFYDVDRNGEGIIIEMLNSSSALVTMFTYDPNGTDLMWMIGVGNIVGNSIVIDTLQTTAGGVFGSSFDANNIVRTDIGGMSIIFPECNSSGQSPGRLVFQPEFEYEDLLDSLLVKSQRLSRLLSCQDLSQANPMSGRSGSFYDPNRSGEGVFVEFLDNGSAVIVVYTYTPDGKQFWLISSSAQINGNTITADMLYPAGTTTFGNQFNPDEIDLQPWGSITLEYQPGCSQISYSYNSSVSGYGSGSYSYQRLTQPAGTTCDL